MDGEARSSEHPLDPLLQFLSNHSEHLQLPITRCYLLLQRASAMGSLRRPAPPPVGSNGLSSEEARRRNLVDPGLVEAGVEVLPWDSHPVGSARPKLRAGGGEPLRERHRQPAPPQCPFPHTGHVTVTGEADLAGLREAKPDAAGSSTQPALPGAHATHETDRDAPRPTGPGPSLAPSGRGTGEATTCSNPNPVQAPQS